MRLSRDHVVGLALVLLSATLFFLWLGTPGLFDADEPAYAQAAREMLSRGDWVTPYFNGQPRFDKPILFYWLLIVSYGVFGITAFAVRFWSALSALGLVLLLWRAARRWNGEEAALWTAIAFSTSLLTALLARAAVTDMLLTFFVTAAILAGLEAMEGPMAGGRWQARALWAAMALAVLVKGPVGVLIPVMALGGCLAALPEARTGLRRLFPWEGPVLFLVIAAPWFVLALSANGWAFVEGFIIKHHVTRFTGVISSHAGPLWFYLPVILVGFFPWSGFLPAALWCAARTAWSRRAAIAGDRLAVTCLCWLTGLFIFFSLAGTKLPSYLFPAFPAMALLVGRTIANEQWTMKNRSMPKTVDRSSIFHSPFSIDSPIPRWVSALTPWLIGMTGGALIAGLLLVLLMFDRLRPAARGVLDGVAPPIGLGCGLAGLLLVGVTSALLARGRWRPALLAATMAGFILVAAGAVAPMAYTILQGALRDFSADARRILGPDDPVVAYGLNAPSVVFYAERRVIPVGAGAPGEAGAIVRGVLATGRPAVVITRSILGPQLKDIVGLRPQRSAGGYMLYVADPEASVGSQ